jgi:hypothetical protein
MTERMVKAVMKALYWIRANREGSIDIIMKNGRLNESAGQRAGGEALTECNFLLSVSLVDSVRRSTLL